MQRRFLIVRLGITDNVLKMLVNEVQDFFQKPDLHPSKALSAFIRPRTFNAFLYRSVALLNGLEPTSKHAHNLYETYKEENTNEILPDPRTPQQFCEFNYLRLNLPSEATELYKLMIALDGAEHELSYNGPSNHCRVSSHYCDHLQNDASSDAIIKHTVDEKNKGRTKQQPSLSRQVATWIIAAYNKDPENLVSYKKTVEHLEEVLKSDSPSLSRELRTWLYPPADMQEALMKICHNDVLITSCLSPHTSHRKGILSLTVSLRDTLIKNKHLPMAEVRKGITEFFNKFTVARTALWDLMIKGLYGHHAALGGIYHENFTEIKLLREAKFYFNRHQLLVLDITSTKAYAEHYANPSEENKNKLEIELRHVCKYLGLQFELEQNFHHNPVFTKDSTHHLIDLRVHISERYFRRLTSASHAMRFFHMPNQVGGEENRVSQIPLELQANIVSSAFEVHPKDLAAIERYHRSLRLG